MINTKYVSEFLENIKLNTDDALTFTKSCENILKYSDDVEKISKMYMDTKRIADSEEIRIFLSKKSGESVYTVNALAIIAASFYLHEEYRKKGYSDDLFYDTMEDLKYKIAECKEVKKVLGTFVESWYDGFFKLNTFKLGRLEFERTIFDYDGINNDCGIKRGDTAYYVHIPSSGQMPKNARFDSYKKAYEFFKNERNSNIIKLFCSSWLLYPENKKIFPKTMNIVDFLNDWKIVKYHKTPSYNDCWRMFGCDYNGNPDLLPSDNTARRAIIKWLKDGNMMGSGFGIMLFDGEKNILVSEHTLN